MKLEPHEERVLVERGEVSEKLERLSAFIETETCLQLDKADRDLLNAQQHYMTAYLGVLHLRVARILQRAA